MKQVSILGCGWLGLPLAQSFLEKGYRVQGSTTSEEKIQKLKETGIHPFLIRMEEEQVIGDMASFLQNSTILIVAIPPKLRNNASDTSSAQSMAFVSKISALIAYIEKSSIEKVLFVSSTSVFADHNTIATETTTPQPETESGKQLLVAENKLLSNSKFSTTVVRFGGLIGDDRHPVYFLSGRSNIENPEAPINLIHQTDCIGIIHKIIETHSWNEIFNAVAPFHPTRKEYYTQKAKALNLAIPEFNQSKPSVGKTILSEKLTQNLNYVFKKPEL